MKKKIFSLVSLAAYLAITVTGFVVGIGALLDSGTGSESSGLGNALTAAILAIIGILAIAYATFALIPTILKLFDVFFQKRALTIICIVFDVLLLLLHLALALSILAENSGSPFGMLALLGCSLLSLIFNILTLHS